MKFLMAYNEPDVQAAIDQINSNCGWPDENTTTWAKVRKSYSDEIWFFVKPPIEGYKDQWKSFTQEQMISGIINVEESDGDSSWFPPSD